MSTQKMCKILIDNVPRTDKRNCLRSRESFIEILTGFLAGDVTKCFKTIFLSVAETCHHINWVRRVRQELRKF